MRYDILINSMQHARAKPVVARQIAQSQKIPLVKALSLCESLPCLYMVNVGEEESLKQIRTLAKLGVAAVRRVIISNEAVSRSVSGELPKKLSTRIATTTPQKSRPQINTIDSPRHTAIFKSIDDEAATPRATAIPFSHRRDSRSRILGFIIIFGFLLAVASLFTCPKLTFSGKGFGDKKTDIENMPPYTPQPLKAEAAQKRLLNQNALKAAQTASMRIGMAIQSDNPDVQRKLFRQAIAADTTSVNGWAGYASVLSPVNDSTLATTIQEQTMQRFGNNAILLADQIQNSGGALSLDRGTNGVCAGFLQVKELPRDSLLLACVQTGTLLRDVCGCSKLALRITTPSGAGIRVWIPTKGDSLTVEAVAARAVFSEQKPDL